MSSLTSRQVLTLNLTRVFSLTQKLVPLLEAANPPDQSSFTNAGGRVIMIGSVDGIRVPALDTYSYSASKAALHQLSRVLASQLAPRGITVNTLAWCVQLVDDDVGI